METWRKIRFEAVVRLTRDVPRRLRWRWRKVRVRGRTSLALVSPRGAVWDFKLNGGAWVRRRLE